MGSWVSKKKGGGGRYDSGVWPSRHQAYLTKFYYLALAMD